MSGEGVTCYERDETLCEDQMCLRTGCRLRNERYSADQSTPKWTLHVQPYDCIADHEYSLWKEGEIVILANGAKDKLEEIVRLVNSIPTLVAALRESERFMAYFAHERTSFEGLGTPMSCLGEIRLILNAIKEST